MTGSRPSDTSGLRTLEVQLSGALVVRLDGNQLGERDLGGRRPRLLLAGLALRPGQALARDELAELLWGDQLPATWATALRVSASKLRAALAGLLGPIEGDLVAATMAGYALDLPSDVAIRVDVLEARAKVHAAADALSAGDPLAAVDLVRSMRPVLERPFLSAEEGHWVERERANQREHLVRGLEVLTESLLALNDPVVAAAAVEDVLAVEPYRESAHRLLMTAHRQTGNVGEALRAYERCRRRLADDLGTMPSAETQRLYRSLLGEEPRRPEPSPALPGRLRLVGRERALATLDQLLAAAEGGHGALALVTGEPGIGKTRVAREVADRAKARGARVLWGTCREPDWAPPFGAVVDLLPELGQLAPTELTHRLTARLVDEPDHAPEEDRLRVREDLRRALLAATQVAPIVVVLDDVHWADDGTLDALRHLGPSVPGAAVLVVATARDAEVEPDSAAGLAIAALTRDPGIARIALPPLEVRHIGDLAQSVHPSAGAWAATIHADTRGNPFFVEAVLLHLVESGGPPAPGLAPTAVRDVVLQRVGRLPEPTQALLRAASLVEGDFGLGFVARAAGLREDVALTAIESALRARLVEPAEGPDTYVFAHAIARHAIAESLAPSRRVRLHRRLAEAIEATVGDSPSPAESAELAGQYHRSASLAGKERGFDHALRAAEHSAATGSPDRAASFYGMALDLLPSEDPRALDLAARRGLALVVGPRHSEGRSEVIAAADAMVAAGDRAGAAQLLADAGWTAELAGYTEEAFALGSAGIDLVADAPRDDVWARLYLLDLRRQEADDPRGLGLPIMTPERRQAATILHADPARRHEMAWAVWDHRDEILDRGEADAWALTMWAGRYGAALPLWRRRAIGAKARGQLADAVSSWAGAASCAVALGHLADAEAWTDRARELARHIELRGAFALHLVGARDQLTHARGGGLDDLMEWVAELTIYRTDRAQRWAEAISYAALARGLAIVGRHDDARSMIDGVLEVLPAAPSTVVSTNRMVGDVVAACWFSRDDRNLPLLADAVRRTLVEPDFRCPMTDPRHVQARLLGLAGEVDDARRWFADARGVAVEDGLRPLQVLIDHDEALLLLRAGRASDAAPLLDAASRRAALLGMVGWVRRTERLALGLVS